MNLIKDIADFLLGFVLVLAVAAVAFLVSPQTEDVPRGVGHGVIWEDDVKWDCETMSEDGCGVEAEGLIPLLSPEDFYLFNV